jgi:hypothetical protein
MGGGVCNSTDIIVTRHITTRSIHLRQHANGEESVEEAIITDCMRQRVESHHHLCAHYNSSLRSTDDVCREGGTVLVTSPLAETSKQAQKAYSSKVQTPQSFRISKSLGCTDSLRKIHQKQDIGLLAFGQPGPR